MPLKSSECRPADLDNDDGNLQQWRRRGRHKGRRTCTVLKSAFAHCAHPEDTYSPRPLLAAEATVTVGKVTSMSSLSRIGTYLHREVLLPEIFYQCVSHSFLHCTADQHNYRESQFWLSLFWRTCKFSLSVAWAHVCHRRRVP